MLKLKKNNSGAKRLNTGGNHSTAIRMVAGSIPYNDIGTFVWHNPSVRTVALESIQLLTEMSTKNILCGGKENWCLRLTTSTHFYADCLEIWESEALETLRTCTLRTSISVCLIYCQTHLLFDWFAGDRMTSVTASHRMSPHWCPGQVMFFFFSEIKTVVYERDWISCNSILNHFILKFDTFRAICSLS